MTLFLFAPLSSWAIPRRPPSPKVQAIVYRMFDWGRALIGTHQQLYLETLYRHFGDRLFHTSLTVMLVDLNLIPYRRTNGDLPENEANHMLDLWRANINPQQVRDSNA